MLTVHKFGWYGNIVVILHQYDVLYIVRRRYQDIRVELLCNNLNVVLCSKMKKKNWYNKKIIWIMWSINNCVGYLRAVCLLRICCRRKVFLWQYYNIICSMNTIIIIKIVKKKPFENVHNNIYEAAELYEFTYYL